MDSSIAARNQQKLRQWFLTQVNQTDLREAIKEWVVIIGLSGFSLSKTQGWIIFPTFNFILPNPDFFLFFSSPNFWLPSPTQELLKPP